MAIKKTVRSKDETFRLVGEFIDKISSLKTLDSVFNCHKELWEAGFRHRGFSPDKHGMFRCNDISTMSKDEVYLGGVYGIWSNTLRFFEDEAKVNDIDLDTYTKVLNQYKSQLVYNLKHIQSQFYNCGVNCEKLCRLLHDRINEMGTSIGHNVVVSLTDGITPGELKEYQLRVNGREFKSSLLVLMQDGKPQVYIPSTRHWSENKHHLPPHVESKSDIKNFVWMNIDNLKSCKIEPNFFRDKFIISTQDGYNPIKTESLKKQKADQEKKYNNYLKM